MSQVLNNLINTLRTQTAANSITPETLGQVLQTMATEIDAAAGTNNPQNEYFFGFLLGQTVPGAVETEIHANTGEDYNNISTLVSLNTGATGAFMTALVDCIVEITGQVGLQPVSSFTSDRVLRWFKYDEFGERYCDSIMTTHFTGTTQIFNIPINYSCVLLAGQALHLTAYASGSAGTIISDNSRINIHVKTKV